MKKSYDKETSDMIMAIKKFVKENKVSFLTFRDRNKQITLSVARIVKEAKK